MLAKYSILALGKQVPGTQPQGERGDADQPRQAVRRGPRDEGEEHWAWGAAAGDDGDSELGINLITGRPGLAGEISPGGQLQVNNDLLLVKSDHVTYILTSHWSRVITWPAYWPLFYREWACDLETCLLLPHCYLNSRSHWLQEGSDLAEEIPAGAAWGRGPEYRCSEPFLRGPRPGASLPRHPGLQPRAPCQIQVILFSDLPWVITRLRYSRLLLYANASTLVLIGSGPPCTGSPPSSGWGSWSGDGGRGRGRAPTSPHQAHQ